MLGDRSIPDFAHLPPDQRQAIIRENLTQSGPIVVHDRRPHEVSPDIADGHLLRDEEFVGDDHAGSQLAKEAFELYYRENTFRVPLDGLRDFAMDRYECDPKKIPIAHLVGGLIVQVDLHDEEALYDRNCDNECCVGQWTRDRLQTLFSFTNARQVTVALHGPGFLNGLDIVTQQTIMDITKVIKRLIDRFGDRFDITKSIDGDSPPLSLRCYWDPPDDLARENIRSGVFTPKHLMQLQIDEWTAEVSVNTRSWLYRKRHIARADPHKACRGLCVGLP
jgi:hypothetical protein